mmetsp:Transcript_50657/g.162127  ORF Transcript_50657/g.162127 Transcript_50657/m.162127 type:complete len:229 (-) Transcript_50657:816-1502(-)
MVVGVFPAPQSCVLDSQQHEAPRGLLGKVCEVLPRHGGLHVPHKLVRPHQAQGHARAKLVGAFVVDGGRVGLHYVLLEIDLRRAAVGHGGGLNHLLEPHAELPRSLEGESSHSAPEHHAIRDDVVRVPSVELGDRYNGRVEGGDLARHYGLEGGDDGCSRDDGVASSVRHGAVPAAPLDGGLEAASGGKEGARAGHDDSGLVGRPHVEPEHLAHPPATSTRLSWALLG